MKRRAFLAALIAASSVPLSPFTLRSATRKSLTSPVLPTGTSIPVLTKVGMLYLIATGDGWEPCDGRAVSRAKYTELFTILAALQAPGASESFNLPDLRGRFTIQSP